MWWLEEDQVPECPVHEALLLYCASEHSPFAFTFWLSVIFVTSISLPLALLHSTYQSDNNHNERDHQSEWLRPSTGLGANKGNSLSLRGTQMHIEFHCRPKFH